MHWNHIQRTKTHAHASKVISSSSHFNVTTIVHLTQQIIINVLDACPYSSRLLAAFLCQLSLFLLSPLLSTNAFTLISVSRAFLFLTKATKPNLLCFLKTIGPEVTLVLLSYFYFDLNSVSFPIMSSLPPGIKSLLSLDQSMQSFQNSQHTKSIRIWTCLPHN